MKKKSNKSRQKTKAERVDRKIKETEKANHIHRTISAANSEQDLLSSLAAFSLVEVNLACPPSAELVDKRLQEDVVGNNIEKIKLKVEFHASPLPPKLLESCLELFEANMGSLYRSSSWGLNLDEKRKELRRDHARFLIVKRDEIDETQGGEKLDATRSFAQNVDTVYNDDKDNSIVAFTHFRFETNDEDISPIDQEVVLYVYEVQVSERLKRGGLGRRLMSIMELIAMKRDGVNKVMLTVFKENQIALNFYTKKMKYVIDDSSPSNFDQDAENIVDYQILSKLIGK